MAQGTVCCAQEMAVAIDGGGSMSATTARQRQ